MNPSVSLSSHILIVDDEPKNLQILNGLLTEYGYAVREAGDGKEAIEEALAFPPDMILMDIKMPNMDGFEACAELKANPKTKEIPIIFISGLTNVNDIVQAFQVGGVDYINKPFQFAEVIARVDKHLTILRQRQQILEQKQQIEAMRKRDQQRFNQLSEMREQFVQSATHDLKNPLSIIRGSAEIMRRFSETHANPYLRECIENILESSKEMTELVTGMLDFLKIQSSLELQISQVKLKPLVANLLKRHEIVARGRNISLKSELEELDAQLDETQMNRVIDNLISNAIKYSPDNSQVHVRLKKASKHVVLEIQDEGFGIAQDDKAKLFTPFFRGKKHDGERLIEGTGLGLAIVKEILDQHRGQIEVETELGKGSTFRVLLPKPSKT
jgi:two-component system sensor histidine kinase/response regulator